MDEIIEKFPELENRVYVISGPRQQAIEEAMAIILRATDRCFISTEFICLRDSKETIENIFNANAASSGSGKGACVYFTSYKAASIEGLSNRIRGSYNRRFVRLTFIDSLDSIMSNDKNPENVLKRLPKCNPVIIVSDTAFGDKNHWATYYSNDKALSLSIA